MKARTSLTMHLSALAIVAAAAMFVFSRPQKAPITGKVVLDADRAHLDKMLLVAPNHKVEVAARKGGGLTLNLSEQKPKLKPAPPKAAVPVDGGSPDGGQPDGGALAGPVDGGAPDGARLAAGDTGGTDGAGPGTGPAAAPELETVLSSFRANEDYEKAVDRLLPLQVERDLGEVDPDQLQKFGLDKPERKLSITARGETFVLVIGQDSYGGATTYIRRGSGGPVYLISSSILHGVDAVATRFMERRMVPFAEKDVERLVVTAPSSARTLEHADREHPGGGRWLPADDPDSKDEKFRNWVGKFFRTSVTEYALEKDLPSLQTIAKLQFERGKETLDSVEIASAESADGKKETYARSAFTGGWVKLVPVSAEGLVTDLPSILGGEAGPEIPPGPAPTPRPAALKALPPAPAKAPPPAPAGN